MDACSFSAIIRQERPCKKACGIAAIGKDELGRAAIDYKKCTSCGQCLVNCPFGAISDKSQIFQTIMAIKSGVPVYVVLVIDAATGQNGLNQALEFNEALGLDGIIMTKLDGTAKGGIAMAVAEKLKLPILRIGVGEQVDDLQEFNAKDFCRALVGESN